jgi:histidyl-tRNA synthetase
LGARLDVFCLIEDEALRPESLRLIQSLRDAGLSADYSFTAAKSDKQFKRALELNAAFTVKIERSADGAAKGKIKNLKSREERTAGLAEIAKFLQT